MHKGVCVRVRVCVCAQGCVCTHECECACMRVCARTGQGSVRMSGGVCVSGCVCTCEGVCVHGCQGVCLCWGVCLCRVHACTQGCAHRGVHAGTRMSLCWGPSMPVGAALFPHSGRSISGSPPVPGAGSSVSPMAGHPGPPECPRRCSRCGAGRRDTRTAPGNAVRGGGGSAR